MIRHGLFAIVCIAAALPLAASPFTNGSFETNTCVGGSQFSGSFIDLAAGNTCITGWTVSSGSTDPGSGTVDLVNTYWQAANGTYSIDLDGTSPGSVSQTFNTVVGTTYLVTFSLSGNPDGGASVKSLQVLGPSGVDNFYFYNTATQGNTHANMMYVNEMFSFVAVSNLTFVAFVSNDAANSAFGPVIDNVTVSAVPEPATFGVIGAALGLLGLLRRRR